MSERAYSGTCTLTPSRPPSCAARRCECGTALLCVYAAASERVWSTRWPYSGCTRRRSPSEQVATVLALAQFLSLPLRSRVRGGEVVGHVRVIPPCHSSPCLLPSSRDIPRAFRAKVSSTSISRHLDLLPTSLASRCRDRGSGGVRVEVERLQTFRESVVETWSVTMV